MKIDAVFSGGGVKAYAFLGALEEIYGANLVIERVAGTSAGAILASFLAAGYSIDEIKQILKQLDLKKLLDPPKLATMIPGSKWLLLYFQLGLYRGRKLESWIEHALAEKGIHTFGDLKHEYLKVVASDLTLGRLVVIPDDLERLYGIQSETFSVAKAVRMSAGFPFFFMPDKVYGKQGTSIIVDGGLLSNFPLWIFEQHEPGKKTLKRPVIGVKLSESVEQTPPRKIKHAIDLFLALFSTMKQAHDARYISKSDEPNIIFIPVHEVETTDFNLSEQTIKQLKDKGRQYTERFLKRWPH
ncbi:MAG TPA: patatin-like phospholipase family protein [Cerasibacillus sp.]|uniref:patatin-like phospholipase family protein n=1 Tax=Cerasibacillus sp. TaxID=2498711 RepID=UPI002F3F9309